jgi:hypothetical protein
MKLPIILLVDEVSLIIIFYYKKNREATSSFTLSKRLSLFESYAELYNVIKKKKNKSEQALQIIDHVVAESCANKRSMHGRRQFVVSTL